MSLGIIALTASLMSSVIQMDLLPATASKCRYKLINGEQRYICCDGKGENYTIKN